MSAGSLRDEVSNLPGLLTDGCLGVQENAQGFYAVQSGFATGCGAAQALTTLGRGAVRALQPQTRSANSKGHRFLLNGNFAALYCIYIYIYILSIYLYMEKENSIPTLSPEP